VELVDSYSLVDNVEPYELFQCSDEYVKNDPYAVLIGRIDIEFQLYEVLTARQVWVPSEV